MQRYALRDDQWAKIEDFLPGREGHVGGLAAANLLLSNRHSVHAGHGCAMTPDLWSDTGLGSRPTGAIAAGAKVAFLLVFSRLWLMIPVPGTRRSARPACAPIDTALPPKKTGQRNVGTRPSADPAAG
jgi:hypothetical protein